MSDPTAVPTLEELATLVAEVERHRLTVVCGPDVEHLLAQVFDRLGFDYPLPDIVVNEHVPDGTVYVLNPAALSDFLARTAPDWTPRRSAMPTDAKRHPFAMVNNA